jgi:hypothetical protein
MFRQYHALKRDHPGAILLFRMGDFYEMFFEDAQEASRLLDLTLTARGKGTDNVAPMCGFPHHQLDAYTAKLVTKGLRVAVCEQTEYPKKAKGLVRREVVRIVTPGTVLDPEQLDPKDNAWVAGVAVASGTIGAAFLDASTGLPPRPRREPTAGRRSAIGWPPLHRARSSSRMAFRGAKASARRAGRARCSRSASPTASPPPPPPSV